MIKQESYNRSTKEKDSSQVRKRKSGKSRKRPFPFIWPPQHIPDYFDTFNKDTMDYVSLQLHVANRFKADEKTALFKGEVVGKRTIEKVQYCIRWSPYNV